MQGSAVRTPGANDVDLAVVINQSEFDIFMKNGYSNRIKKNGISIDMSNMSHQDLLNLSKDITQNPSIYHGVARNDFNYNFPNKIIKATPDKGVISGFKDRSNEIQVEFPNLNIENITIQEYGSTFDLKPYLNL